MTRFQPLLFKGAAFFIQSLVFQSFIPRIPHIEIESGFPSQPKVLNYKEYHIFKR